ncbi:MAG: hypothetical protein PHF63_09180 [Herbinix sp.]|nr:hypothetical protein [Herbinix sp.]
MEAISTEALTPEDLPDFGLVIKRGTNNGTGIGNLTLYTYDHYNRLMSMKAGNTSASYQYNAQGYRVEKTVNNKTTKYLYKSDKVVLETDATGKQTAYQAYGSALLYRAVSADSEVGAQNYYYLYNAHGDVTALIDSVGNIAATYDYDAFGTMINETGSADNHIKYAGYQSDDESGLYYLNARYYDSTIARFITEDDVRYSKRNDPLSLNLYTYCQSNPVRFVDPTGHTIDQLIGKYLVSGFINIDTSSRGLKKSDQTTNKLPINTITNADKAENIVSKSIDRGSTSQGSMAGVIASIANNIGSSNTGLSKIENYVPGSSKPSEIQVYHPGENIAISEAVIRSKNTDDITTLSSAQGNFSLSTKGICGNIVDWWKDKTKSGDMDWFLKWTLGAEKDKNGIYHIRQDWWQSWKYVGYNDLYDWTFDAASSMDSAKFEFTYNNSEKLIFWAWKGDYINLGAGAELGIYYGGEPHWLTGTKYAMPMTLTLYQNEEQLFYWAPDEDNWWITGFDTNPANEGVLAEELTAVFTIDFSGNKDMYYDFIISDDYLDNKDMWEISEDNKYILTLTF